MPRQFIAAKRLATVEVSGTASNQHEFNATLLRRALHVEETRISGVLTTIYHTEDNSPPVIEETDYTLYDSRENQPNRSAEYRLYYRSHLLQELGQEGDLIVFVREPVSADLSAIVARQGTDVERELERILSREDDIALQRFVEVPSTRLPREQGEFFAHALASPESPEEIRVSPEDSPVFTRAVEQGEIPSTAEMASEAQRLVVQLHGENLNPDEFLYLALDAETALFYEIERFVRRPELQDAMRGADGIDFDHVIEVAISIQQARRSRRGLSLQHHFEALLQRESIPFTAQCETELGETADFVVPSCEAYGDPTFPDDHLRMVACKSTSRERWRQILNEADRIEEKYLLTIDENISDKTIQNMASAGLFIFLPEKVITDAYECSRRRDMLNTASTLVFELENVC